jgi:hypothetical protein
MSVPNSGGALMRYRDLGLKLILAQSVQDTNHEDVLLDELNDLWAEMSADERVQSEAVNRELREFFRGGLASGHNVVSNQPDYVVCSLAQQSSRETILNDDWRDLKMSTQWIDEYYEKFSSLGASVASPSLRKTSARNATTLFAIA